MHRPTKLDFLTMERLGEELVLYHPLTQKALCLDPVATRVFDLCDGRHSEEEIGRALGDEEAARAALELLADHHLLVEPPDFPRRSFLKKAAVLVPVILAVAAPEPAMAASALSCVNASACNDPGVAASCPGCDPFNPVGGPDPGQCAIQNCLTFFHIPVDAGNNITSPDCTGDSQLPLVTCELTRPGDFWSRDCATSRAKVINQWIMAGRPVSGLSNYKCCPGCCATPCP